MITQCHCTLSCATLRDLSYTDEVCNYRYNRALAQAQAQREHVCERERSDGGYPPLSESLARYAICHIIFVRVALHVGSVPKLRRRLKLRENMLRDGLRNSLEIFEPNLRYGIRNTEYGSASHEKVKVSPSRLPSRSSKFHTSPLRA